MLPALPILDLLQDCEDPPLTRGSLERLQLQLGKRFPEEYAEFLLRFNGGHFVRAVEFSIPRPTEFVTGARILSFLGEPGVDGGNYGLRWVAEALDDRLAPEYLAIADCNCGDAVVLKLVESRFEGVWYWDSSAMCVAEDAQAYYWLAESFYEFMALLLQDVCDADNRERAPLFQDVERGALSAIERYLTQGGDVGARNEHGHTLLMAAAIYRWPKLVRLLLQNGANLEARDHMGRTALHHAALHSVDSVKHLLAAGADASARDAQGKSVLGNWSNRADRLLRAHGAVE
jgi:hypothetical protein